MPKLQRPTWLNPNEKWVNQGEKFAPLFTLPDGKFLAPWQKRKDVTPQSIIGRAGVVAIGNYDAPANIQHGFHHANDVYRNHIQKYGIAPGRTDLWTESMVAQAALAYALYPCEGNDFGEGTNSFSPISFVAQIWYYNQYWKYIDSNPTGIIRRDYGHHGNTSGLQGGTGDWYLPEGSSVPPTHAYFRDRYQSRAAARNGIAYFNTVVDGERGEKLMEELVGFNVKNYADSADYARSYYQKRYAIEIMALGMGKVGGVSSLPGRGLVYNDWSKLEGIQSGNPQTLHNGHEWRRRIEAGAGSGTVLSGEHPQINYDWQVGCALINGFLYADGLTTFDVPTRFGVDPLKMSAVNEPGPGNDNVISVRWVSDNGTTPAPVSSDGFPIEPLRWHDAGYEAAYYYSQFANTSGVKWQPIAYKFAGSETLITPPADGASILEHAAAFDGPNTTAQGARRGRPTVDGRVKNSKFDFVAFDASRSGMYHEEIRVLAPNGIDFIPTVLTGCKPNVHSETV